VSDALVSVLTALADDELVLGHRHSEWTGFAPHIEEDVAFSSIAQDEIGHAGAYYSLLAEIQGVDADSLALGRGKSMYRHAILCERSNGDWAYTLARHWLYDHADEIRLESLEDSSHPGLVSLARKIRREERYHLLHADAWITRVAHGPIEGRRKLVDVVAGAFVEASGLFEPFELEDAAVKEGILPVPSPELRQRFEAKMVKAFDELGFPTEAQAHAEDRAEFVASSSGDLIAGEGNGERTAPVQAGLGGRRGHHTEEFDGLWDDMTITYRNNPGATW
jgi:ring-1,2-phenylacetyl-CoA epoxidase subunit PaaC